MIDLYFKKNHEPCATRAPHVNREIVFVSPERKVRDFALIYGPGFGGSGSRGFLSGRVSARFTLVY